MAARFVRAMAERGIECLVEADFRPDIVAQAGPTAVVRDLPQRPDPAVELVVVFGGDGTILRAGGWAVEADIPLLGVNLGHVGFLAELEVSQFDELVERVVARDWALERRLTLSVDVYPPAGDRVDPAVSDQPWPLAAQPVWSSLVINEASLEKHSDETMIEVLASVDQSPVSRWATDGVLVSTPTGSTAYAFSAGGPVLWPDLEAFLLVPVSAHALFNRALVLAPQSVVWLDLVSPQPAILWCDGKRRHKVAPGSRVVVRRSDHYLTMARLSVQPFTSRLVKKFALPIEGWRGQRLDR
jgi:NAD+ kinase